MDRHRVIMASSARKPSAAAMIQPRRIRPGIAGRPISILGLFLVPQVASAFYATRQPGCSTILSKPASSSKNNAGRRRRRNERPLHGIAEWRAKFSSTPEEGDYSAASNDVTTTPAGAAALPLLLLPFTPHQILLPSQATTLQFRHGKYIDLIDEALTSYEAVIGLSVLDEDGLLAHVVVCEVLEEELEVTMGYKGIGGVEVGVRGVGRAKRVDHVADDEVKRKSASGRTAQDDIHFGHFVEWEDEPLLTGDQLIGATEHLDDIEGLLMLSSQSRLNVPKLDGGIRQRQQSLYREAYASSYSTIKNDDRERRQPRSEQHAHLVASSWAALAAADAYSRRSPSVITRALATQDTAERLRLGLAALLESRTMMPATEDVVEGNAVEEWQ